MQSEKQNVTDLFCALIWLLQLQSCSFRHIDFFKATHSQLSAIPYLPAKQFITFKPEEIGKCDYQFHHKAAHHVKLEEINEIDNQFHHHQKAVHTRS
jgi:hypothetical protein